MKLQQTVYHDKHGKGKVVRKQNLYFWVKYDKYEKLLRHEQKQVGRSVKLKPSIKLKPSTPVKLGPKRKFGANWKVNDDVIYIGNL